MNKILCEISLGELVDKLSIVKIKLQKIDEPIKRNHLMKEEVALTSTLAGLNLLGIDIHLQQMIEINLVLWKIEDDIRELEQKSTFDDKFIQLARAVYKNNDERFKRKNIINSIFQSNIVEVKSYQDY